MVASMGLELTEHLVTVWRLGLAVFEGRRWLLCHHLTATILLDLLARLKPISEQCWLLRLSRRIIR